MKANVHSLMHLALLQSLVTGRRRPPKSTTVRAFALLRQAILSDLNLVDAKANAMHAMSLHVAHLANKRLMQECVSRGRLQARLHDDALDQLNMDLLRIGATVKEHNEQRELEANLETVEGELRHLVSDDESSSSHEPCAEL